MAIDTRPVIFVVLWSCKEDKNEELFLGLWDIFGKSRPFQSEIEINIYHIHLV